MKQMPLFDASTRWTVSDLNRYLRQLLEADGALQGIWVEGEVSNFSRPSSGHVYFSLKDAGAQLRCVMWRSDVARLRFAPQDGMAVEVHGRISVYEAGGQYQLYADLLHPVGEGALYREFLRLKALLEAEGLFDLQRKRELPERPGRIGIVTSPTGAALGDMLNTLRRRNPLPEVILAPAPVQGDEAPPALVAALESLNRVARPDVILLARGGGSIEDLWAFNDERVVRAVAGSEAPVISGVGHETDFTLADFAADLRAPTPTAAAELATPVTLLDLQTTLIETRTLLAGLIRVQLERRCDVLDDLRAQVRLFSPARRLQTERQRLDELSRRGNAAQGYRLRIEAERLKGLEARLLALSPLGVLQRGFALIMRKVDGALVTGVAQAGPGTDLRLRLRDGEIEARVMESDKDKHAET
ncbi:MAG: exodeoxyribonuclease VII large subunit [Anaerolineales bacterium]|nr:exodeoxyribonuclease VII large subunit [Anaerolineales bacterium]